MSNRLLVKLLPSVSLAASDPRANLRPLYDSPQRTAAFGLGAQPDWFLADLPEGAETPWDLAHSQVAGQLGIDESAILFAEPDLDNSFPDTNEKNPGGAAIALDANCDDVEQQDFDGKKKGPNKFAWHLDDEFTQLRSARSAVTLPSRERASRTSIPVTIADTSVSRKTCFRISSVVLSTAMATRTVQMIVAVATPF